MEAARSPERWYPLTNLHSMILQKSAVSINIAMRVQTEVFSSPANVRWFDNRGGESILVKCIKLIARIR
jgi:hypothetical protein